MSLKDLLITNRKAVRESLEKTEAEILTDIQIIKEWFKTQKHIPEIPSDNMIEVFLMGNKFSIELTKQKLDMYYSIRSLIPDVFHDSHPLSPRIINVTKSVMFIPLPKLTEELYRVCIIKFVGASDNLDLYKLFALCANINEMRIMHDLTAGDVYIADFQHVTMGHLLKMTPVHLRVALTISEKVHSNRIKGLHMVNCPSFIDTLINLLKSVIKPKLFGRLIIHENVDSLYKHFDKEILPTDYNGLERSLDQLNGLWLNVLKEYSDRFDKLEQLKVNEELRPMPLDNDEILGYHGNFKKLDVD